MGDKFQLIREAVEKELSCSAHDLDHVKRVLNLSLEIAKDEDVDFDIITASALLHDIARVREDNDNTGKTDHALLGAEIALPILKQSGFSEKKIRHIQQCIRSHRYRSGHKPETMEAKILFDSDKLDALGAIGIARSFVWVGRNNARIFNDEDLDTYIRENLNGKMDGRINDKSRHCPRLEYETKFKYLSNNLYTKKARQLGIERSKFFKIFLERLDSEINCNV